MKYSKHIHEYILHLLQSYVPYYQLCRQNHCRMSINKFRRRGYDYATSNSGFASDTGETEVEERFPDTLNRFRF